MFQGSIPQELRQILHEQAVTWDVEDVYVGCSGNFTIERTLAQLRPFHLWGNDVSVYSVALGTIQAGGEFPIKVKAEHHDEWGWLEEWGATPVDQAATVLLCSRMLEGLGRENAWYERLRQAHRDDWPRLHAETKRKYGEQAIQLSGFYAGDVRAFMASATKVSAFASFPPFYSRGYEAMFAGLAAVLDWPTPTYETMDTAGAHRVLELAQQFAHWLIGTNEPVPALERHLRGYVKTTPRAMPFWVYASGAQPRVVVPRQATEPPLVPHLHPTAEIGSEVRLAPLTGPQFDALRSLCLNPGIAPGGPAIALAVLVDGYLIGACGYKLYEGPQGFRWKGIEQPSGYLLSDFPLPASRYKRLAKLIAMVAVSAEACALAERYANHRIRSITTTAFSANPQSMKYRGVLDLVKRTDHGEARDLAEHRFRYELAYATSVPRWTLAEALALWKQKHAEER